MLPESSRPASQSATAGSPTWGIPTWYRSVFFSGAEFHRVAPRVESAGNGVERQRDAAFALVGRHGVQHITRKQNQVARRRRRADPSVGIERRRRYVGVLVLEDKLGASGRLREHGL